MDAVEASTNWRSVLRVLGYGERSSSSGATTTHRFKESWLVTVGHHPDTHPGKATCWLTTRT
jgi:hypothetical protein